MDLKQLTELSKESHKIKCLVVQHYAPDCPEEEVDAVLKREIKRARGREKMATPRKTSRKPKSKTTTAAEKVKEAAAPEAPVDTGFVRLPTEVVQMVINTFQEMPLKYGAQIQPVLQAVMSSAETVEAPPEPKDGKAKK